MKVLAEMNVATRTRRTPDGQRAPRVLPFPQSLEHRAEALVCRVQTLIEGATDYPTHTLRLGPGYGQVSSILPAAILHPWLTR